MTDITITLDAETALVLFGCLGRWDSDGGPLELRDKAEEYAILKVMAGLETALAAPFRKDYERLLEAARAELSRRAGAAEAPE